MLKQLARLNRARSILIVAFAIIVAFTMIFFGGFVGTGTIEPGRDQTVVAKVGSDSVTVADLARLRESYTQYFGSQMNLESRRLLDGLIRDKVIAQEAARLGLGASDEEVAEKIRNQFKDASGVFIGLERYKESVSARFGDVAKFEQSIRDSIALDKLKVFVTASVNVSDREVEDAYRREKTTLDVNYVVLNEAKVAEKIQLTDEELRSYFEQRKTDYRLLEPQRKVRYVYINFEKAGSKLAISDDELRKTFDSLAPERKEAGVRVQQIMLRVARQDLDAQVEQKTKDLIAKLRGKDGKATEEAFAEVARGNSEDPATARSGGFLPRPVKKNPTKPDALYERAVDMQPGDVTDVPIKYAGNYYILRRGESVPKTFAEARQELLVSARNTQGYAAAAKLADRAQTRLKENKNPQQVAQELAAEANMTAADMVRETPFVKSGDDVPNIGNNQEFFAAIEALNNPNDLGEKTRIKEGFAIPILVEKKEPRIPEFDEVKDKVATALKQQKAREQLEQRAKEIVAAAGNAEGLKAAAEKAGLEFRTEEGYSLGSPLGEAGTSGALDDALFAMNATEITRTPLKVGDSWVVAGITKRTDADMAAFASQRDQLARSLLTERQNQVFDDYVAEVMARMKREGEIKIYDEVITQLDANLPAAAPQPQFPFPTQ